MSKQFFIENHGLFEVIMSDFPQAEAVVLAGAEIKSWEGSVLSNYMGLSNCLGWLSGEKSGDAKILLALNAGYLEGYGYRFDREGDEETLMPMVGLLNKGGKLDAAIKENFGDPDKEVVESYKAGVLVGFLKNLSPGTITPESISCLVQLQSTPEELQSLLLMVRGLVRRLLHDVDACEKMDIDRLIRNAAHLKLTGDAASYVGSRVALREISSIYPGFTLELAESKKLRM